VDAAADWTDRSPMVERIIVRGTIRPEDEAERSRWRVCTSETHWGEDHKNGRPGLRMAVRRKSVPLPRLSLRPIG